MIKTYFLEHFTKLELSQFAVYLVGQKNKTRAIAVTDKPVDVPHAVRVMDGDHMRAEAAWLRWNPITELLEEHSRKRWTKKERDAAVDGWFASRLLRQKSVELYAKTQAWLRDELPKIDEREREEIARVRSKYEKLRASAKQKATTRLFYLESKRQKAKEDEYSFSEAIVRTHGPGPYDLDDRLFVAGLSGGHVMLIRSQGQSLGNVL